MVEYIVNYSDDCVNNLVLINIKVVIIQLPSVTNAITFYHRMANKIGNHSGTGLMPHAEANEKEGSDLGTPQTPAGGLPSPCTPC